MAGDVRYVRKRKNGVYYYERRVPSAVIERREDWQRFFGGVILFRRSLETRRQVNAMQAAIEVHRDFDQLVATILGRGGVTAIEDADNASRPVTPASLLKIRKTVQEEVARPWAQAVSLAYLGGAHADELERMAHQRELDADLIRRLVLPRGLDSDPRLDAFLEDPRFEKIDDYVKRAVRRERFDAPKGSNAWVLLATAVREGMAAGEEEIDQLLAGKKSAIPAERFTRRAASAPRISEVVADYIRSLTAGRTIAEVKSALAAFVAVVGDLPLDEISRADFIRFCEHEGAKTVGGKDPHSIPRPVSPDTLKKKVGLLRAAINRRIRRDPEIGVNPAANIDASLFAKPVARAVMPAKRPFDVHELGLILQHPWFTGCASETAVHRAGPHRLNGAHYWAPVLAMHSGCRAGELGGLRVCEVRLDHAHPHIVVQDNEYRTTKGSYRRRIPILDVLLENGFGEFVERIASEGHDRLFPDWTGPGNRVDASSTAWSNAGLIRAFNRTLLPMQLKGILQAGVRQQVTFHGFRGAFKTLLGRHEYGIPTNYKHEVIGHAKDPLDKRYVGEIDLAETYEAIHRCAYRGLVLPSAP